MERLEFHSFFNILYHFHILPKWLPEVVPISWFVMLIIVIISYLSTRNLQKIPHKLQAFMEMIVEFLEDLFKDFLGERTYKFLPLLGGFFIYIFIINLFGIIPGMKSPTTNFNTTVSLALITFLTTHYIGMREHGVLGYLNHFIADVKGMPFFLFIFLAPLLFVIHLISEFARPVTLSVRLFMNIFAEDLVIALLIMLSPIFFPLLPLPMMAFTLFISLVQAAVFTLLSTFYISGAIGETEH